MDKRTKIERIGFTKENAHGSLMEIIEYKNKRDMLVRFNEHDYITFARYTQFKKGTLKSPYDRTVFGVGYHGEGDYKATENNKGTIQYRAWVGMLERGYDEDYKSKKPTYREVTVCEEWHNFQNFAKWYDDNYYDVGGEKMNLDKDILVKGNKIYSPDTCIFVPRKINMLFIKSDATRGDLPIGVSYYKVNNKYTSNCRNGEGKQVFLGYYINPEDAFQVYKTYKEKLIKQIAEDYKDRIPEKLYNAMITYEVEITD